MPTSQGTSSSEVTQHKNSTLILICLVLTILTVITFWQLKDCGFITFDDDIYVYENASVQSVLNWNSISRAFSSELAEKSGFWHPVTWLSLMLDYQIFGLNPHGYHLINLLFHVMNTILLFLIFYRMTKTLWQSAFVACLFAIHPLHAESVAWIAERKDVLCSFFWMLTMGAYSYYVEYPEFRRYFLVLLFFVLGLMAKSMLVTLPFVLLLLDCWPLQRFQKIRLDYKIQTEVCSLATSNKQKWNSQKKHAVKGSLEAKKSTNPKYKWALIYPILWEKVPLFILAILSGIVTYVAEQKVGAIESIKAFPLSIRVANAFFSYITYIWKMIWPTNLAVYYPYPESWIPWQVFGSVLLFIAVTLGVVWMARRFPYLAVGWFWYTGTLIPVIGIVQIYNFAMADRYTYIPLIGLFIMVAWGVPGLLKQWRYRKEAFFTLSVFGILCLCIITGTQVGYWQNSIKLFEHVLKVTDHNSVAYSNLGNAHYALGNYRQAIEDYDKAIEIDPHNAEAYSNRSVAYKGLGNYKQAIEDLDRAIEIEPRDAAAYSNRGIAYSNLNNYRQAINDFNRAIEIKPSDVSAYNNRGIAYSSLNNYRQAITDFDRAIEIKPSGAEAYNNRGIAYSILNNYRQAITDFDRAIKIKPGYAEAYYYRGIAYGKLGNYSLAVEDLKTAVKFGYKDAKNLLRRQGINW